MDCTEKYALWGRRRRDESSWQPPSRIFLLVNVCPIGVDLCDSFSKSQSLPLNSPRSHLHAEVTWKRDTKYTQRVPR